MGGANLYGFCAGNPVNESDPSKTQEREGRRGGNPFISEEAAEWIDLCERIGRGREESEAAGRAGGSIGQALALRNVMRGMLRQRISPEVATFLNDSAFDEVPQQFRATVQEAFSGNVISGNLKEDMIVYRRGGGSHSKKDAGFLLYPTHIQAQRDVTSPCPTPTRHAL